MPYLPGAEWLGFVPLPITLGLIGITAAYVIVSDAAKKQFFLREARRKKE